MYSIKELKISDKTIYEVSKDERSFNEDFGVNVWHYRTLDGATLRMNYQNDNPLGGRTGFISYCKSLNKTAY